MSSPVYEQLRDAVVSGRYLPNERLVETALAESFGVNRVLVREALARLTQEGLVERQAHRGARVRLIGVDEVLEILEVRGGLEGLAAARAARRATAAERDRFRSIAERMGDHLAASELPAYSAANRELHQAIVEVSGSRPLIRQAELLRSQSSQYRFWTLLVPGRMDASLEEHRGIVDAVVAADADLAEERVRHHLTNVREATRRAAEITGSPEPGIPTVVSPPSSPPAHQGVS